MAESSKPKQAVGSGFRFTPVTQTTPVSGGALRDEANSTVRPSGRSVLNVEGSEKWDGLVLAEELNPDQCFVRFGVNEEAGLVSAYPTTKGTLGAVQVRGDATGRVLHMGGVFKKHPTLRVPGARECVVTPDVDADGEECLIIAVTAGVVKPTRSRGKKSGTEQVKAAEPGKQPGAAS